jgi:hypothetical protein
VAEDRELTYGERAVGLDFNPSGDAAVARVKALYAEIIDMLAAGRECRNSGETIRLHSAAITAAQGAQMWAVKAITWKDEDRF